MKNILKALKSIIIQYIGSKTYKRADMLMWGILGGAIFIAIYGWTPLNVQNDHWLLNGYVELDATQHYAGWLAYRQSDWTIPLGRIEGLGGTTVTYTDSIPWIAILFKCVSNILPATFQYFGIYILACMVLQAISAGLLISLFSENKLYTDLGVILFCCSPVMLERAFRHSALASHWLILFMLYFYFKGRKQGYMDGRSCLIPFLAIGIHPYFLPIVFGLMFANLLELFIGNHKSIIRSVIYLISSLGITIVAGYSIGALGTSASLGGGGYGYYSMNLNAIINPISCGKIVWSRFLRILPQTLGNYDGFNYLGAGVLMGVIIVVLLLIANVKTTISWIKRNSVLIVLCIGFWLFAVSNVVTLDENILFEYYLPDKILSIAAIFRASSRMFYPVFYLIILTVVVKCYRFTKQGRCIGALFFLVVLQLTDTFPALQVKHESFENENIETEYKEGVFTGSDLWNDIAKKHLKIKILSLTYDYKLAAFGEKYMLDPDIAISSTHYSGGIDLEAVYQKNAEEIENRDMDSNSVYVTADKNVLSHTLGLNPDVNLYNDSGYYVLTTSNLKLDGEQLNIDDFGME